MQLIHFFSAASSAAFSLSFSAFDEAPSHSLNSSSILLLSFIASFTLAPAAENHSQIPSCFNTLMKSSAIFFDRAVLCFFLSDVLSPLIASTCSQACL